ncbi:hypothetical protein [Nocardia macrotermitis]|uniref:PaaX family transcriptional regulator n=1 Tax=Nocardia macrotermitis TaxID=2585198 RepID=A0A7K0CWQ6_9NOCA|nr:hypothetical protein [Nocardia macrotermitis]MQY17925.1 hypothetical protein [Nocardia macrotermitis]
MSERISPELEGAQAFSSSIALVPFLFGLAQRSELGGTALTTLLTDLGQTPSAARGTIMRLRRAGNLVGRREGRNVHYRLAGQLAAGFDRLTDASAAPNWTGEFHALLFSVPEAHRPFRDTLRRSAVMCGYGILQQGVLISLADHWPTLSNTLPPRPPDATLYPARLALPAADAARAAATAWQLPARADRLDHHRRQLRKALRDNAPTPGPAALRRLDELLNPPMQDILTTPRLPPDLLPDHWPLPALWSDLDEINHRYGPPAKAHVDRTLNGPL